LHIYLKCIVIREGQYKNSLKYLFYALDYCLALNDRENEVVVYLNLASVYSILQRHGITIQYNKRAIEILKMLIHLNFSQNEKKTKASLMNQVIYKI